MYKEQSEMDLNRTRTQHTDPTFPPNLELPVLSSDLTSTPLPNFGSGEEDADLPISPAGQTMLSFWLCNAEPGPFYSDSSSSGISSGSMSSIHSTGSSGSDGSEIGHNNYKDEQQEQLQQQVLVEASPRRGFSTWDFGAFESVYLQPIMDVLAPVVELSVVGQVGA
jgi:hypothetical protein